jgi:hypothetical protein
LPIELQLAIVEQLDKPDKDRVSRTSKQWSDVVRATDTHLVIKTPADLARAVELHQGGRIRRLTLRSGEFTDADLVHLKKFTNLRELDVSDCWGLTDACMAQVPCTVKKLSVARCTKLTDACMADLPPDLEEANFGGCELLTDACMAQVPRTVKKLNVADCP